MKFASDPVSGIQTTKTGAPHQNTPRQPIMQDVNQEGKEDRENTPSKEMGIGLEADDIDERSIAGENVPPSIANSIGDETVDTIGQVRLVIVDKIVQQLQETYDDSVGTSAISAAAKASSEFVQQKVVEHKKVLV